MPVGNVLVGDAGRDVKHDDTALSCYKSVIRSKLGKGKERTLNVISISQTTEFFLSGGIPCIETDLTKVGVECDGVN